MSFICKSTKEPFSEIKTIFMKKLLPALFVCFVIALICSCAPSQTSKEKSLSQSGQSSDQSPAVSSSAAVETGSDTSRKFIRTADLRFRVPDVIKTTYKIEDIVRMNGGFVTFTNLASTVDYEDSKTISADSTLVTTHFTINNSMTLRVPNTELDTTLKLIAPLIEFLDYRIIKATDVGLDLLSNRLTQQRTQKHDDRLSKVVDAQGNKLKDITSASESILYSQEKADQALISNLSLKDQISFSTINLQLYQRPSVKYSLVANQKNIREYEPGFWKKAADALRTGFDVFKIFILFLLQIWWLILLIAVAFFIYPKIRKRKTPAQ